MRKYRKENQHFVVMGTHPDHPNYGPQMRGRKLHLSVTIKRSTKTLCNMLVVEAVKNGSPEADRDLCLSCIAVADKVIDRRFNQTTYAFTVNTDASFYIGTGISAWAAWIKSTHYTIKQSGLFPEGLATNSSVAELLAVEQALLLLDNLIAEEPFLQSQRILLYFNTDSQFTVKALSGQIRRTKHGDLIDRVKGRVERYEIVSRHVKGHTKGKQEAREWVNNWCDKEARTLANKRWRELNARTKTTKKV